MVNLVTKIHDWIDEIPDHKLDGAYVEGRPIHITRKARLDLQGLTTNEPKRFNLQVQINNQCDDTTMAKLKPKSVAWVLAPIEDPWTPQQIRDALKDTVTGFEVRPPREKKVEEKVEEKKGKGKK